jgi:hypothetical protein
VGSSTALALRSDVVATVLDDGALLLDLETKYFFVLNPSAWALVQPFEQGATPAEVGAAALAVGLPDATFAEQVADALVREGLAEPCDRPAAAAVTPPEAWTEPTIERQAEPLQKVMISAFDPSIPLAE